MKRFALLCLATLMLFGTVPQFADAKSVHVKSYTKKNGTHVSSHSRQAPHHKR